MTAQRHGQTALHFCFAFGYAEVGDYLISKGADPHLKNESGLTCYEGLDRARPINSAARR